MAGLAGSKVEVAKTIKLFINGEFPRTESGRSYPVNHAKHKKVYANLSLASRKDFRNAVVAAKEVQPSWSQKSAYNRGQILYRVAEMLEARRSEFHDLLIDVMDLSAEESQKELDSAIEGLVYYAGFTDKYQQLVGAVNPVSGPHHNFTTPEPLGLVGVLFSEETSFSEIFKVLAAVIATGNSVVSLLPDKNGVMLSGIGEVIATSDVPRGVVNLLSGSISELSSHFGSHMEVQGITYLGSDEKLIAELSIQGADNLKRLAFRKNWNALNLDNLLHFVEYKTVWHPVGF